MMLNHRNHAIRMTMSNVNRDILGASALSWLNKIILIILTPTEMEAMSLDRACV